jgi:hypothetical protein
MDVQLAIVKSERESTDEAVALWDLAIFRETGTGLAPVVRSQAWPCQQELPSWSPSGFSEDLIGQIGSDWNAEFFALVRLDHEQDPQHQA